jgi:hypothetical protein
MVPDDASICASVGNDQEAADHQCAPAPFAKDEGGHDAPLPIDAGMNILDIWESGLDFIDRERALRGSPTQEIDRPAFAEVVERVFDNGFPARRSVTAYRLLDERRVAGIQELGAICWREAWVDIGSDAQGGPQTANRREGESLELPPFDKRHDIVAHAGAPGDVRLPETVADS